MDGDTHYRLAWGEVTTPGIVAQRIRWALLVTAERLYPAMREEIEEMARRYAFPRMAAFFDLREELREWVDGYCRKWGLIESRQPAGWALDMVALTLARTSLVGKWTGWHIGAGAALTEGAFRPEVETLAAAKRRIPRRRWAELREAVKAAVAGGAEVARSRRNVEVVEWAARHQFGGETWREVAAGKIGNGYAPDYAAAVKMQARELLRLAGLSRPRGRRRRW